MNIYVGWFLGTTIIGVFIFFVVIIERKKGSTTFYEEYNKLISLAISFLPITGVLFAYPFFYNKKPYINVIEWERVIDGLFVSCLFEIALMFIYILIFIWQTKSDRAEAALRDKFLEGALKYGVSNNHFEPHHSYKVVSNNLRLNAPLYYMHNWSINYSLPEVTLIEKETGEKQVMSIEHLWVLLKPFGRPGNIVFPWVVEWEEGTFPKKDFQRWCKANGISLDRYGKNSMFK